MTAAIGDLVYDNGPSDGVNSLSNFAGVIDGSAFNRVVADDFELNMAASIKQVECPEDVCPPCVGDINDSGVVDGADLLLLLGCWGPVEPGCECADLNSSGVVDGADLLLLLGNWGPCPQNSGEGGNVFDENEPKCERLNDGCNIDPPMFDDISCGDTVCGTAWTDLEFVDPPDGHVPGSCEGFCGGQSDDDCWCDNQCFGFGDCCVDVCEHCEPPDVPECVSGEAPTRDTDWYRFTVKDAKQTVKWQIHAEFPATAIIGWAPADCDPDEIIIIASATGSPEVPFEISACLQPEVEYFLFVAPTEFEGLPCDKNDPDTQWGNEYTATVVCEDGADCPKGACCFGQECADGFDEIVCGLEGGNYAGHGSECADDPCTAFLGACCLKDGQCSVTTPDECINDLKGAYRGNATTCDDMVLIDIGCDGVVEEVPLCRNCHKSTGEVWCNPEDICDEDIDSDPFNGGCNYYPEDPAFEQVCCGDLVGGTVWAIDGVGRDLDWRHLSLKEDSVVLLTISHGFGDVGLDAVLFIARAGCPATIVTSATVQSGQSLIAMLDAGKYYVIVAPEFAQPGGPNLQCGTASSTYQLQIECGAINDQLCENQCGSSFMPHPGYPGGFCSCDPNFCSQPFGGTDPNNPDHCCPGICDFCDDGVCDVADCEAALDITANINGPAVMADNTGATGEGALPAGSPSCHWLGNPLVVHGTVWFKFDAPSSGQVTVQTCGSPAPFQDSLIAVYSGSCGTLLEIGCDDIGCQGDTAPYLSQLSVSGLVPGETYYISVSNSGGWAGSTEGPFQLTITSP